LLRSPTDVALMGQLFGLTQQQAIESMTEGPSRVFKHAHQRNIFKGSAELLD